MCVQGMQKQFKSAVKNPETDVLVDLDKKTVVVKSINPISDADIKERVKNAGYNVKKIERLDKKAVN
jgi:copper chaperone CopZ